MEPQFAQVITTLGSADDAHTLARALVEQRLAACVQIVGPVTSVYRWQDRIEEAQEYLCLIKTRLELYQRLEQAIRAVHPYQVPEILAFPVAAGSRDYLAWLSDQTVSG